MEYRFSKLTKLKRGDKVAILSPSFAAPGKWPQLYELGLSRLQNDFGLKPVEFPTTRKLGASIEEKSKDIIRAFEDKEIKGVIASIGGNDQVTYIKNLPSDPFIENPKPFFGFSDNSHFANFLWLHGIPSYYGGSLMTQFSIPIEIDEFTKKFMATALFETGEKELQPSYQVREEFLSWNDPNILNSNSSFEKDVGWQWDGETSTEGITWGGCLESIDEMLRHNIPIPSNEDFKNTILITETPEEIPSVEYVFRVYRAFGELGILSRVKGVLVGRPQAWYFDKPYTKEKRQFYREEQRQIIIDVVRRYNKTAPIIQNLDFGHTNPQIPMPYGRKVRIDSKNKKIFADF